MHAPRDGRFAPAARAARTSVICAALATGLLAAPRAALASPGVDGTRNLSMGNGGRASASGTNAAITNPSHMSFGQQFAIEPMYQLRVRNLTHGVGIVVMDSLNNARFALGLGYLFTRGSPEVEYVDSTGVDQKLELSHFGHEVLGSLSVVPVKQWLSIGIKPKYQYTSLRYRDADGEARNANKKLNAFGLDASISLNLMGWVHLAAVGYNLVGPHDPAFTHEEDGILTGIDMAPMSFDRRTVSRLSDYPRAVAHGLAIYPLNHPDFSLNFDGTYDFTSYWDCGTSDPCADDEDKAKHTRMTLGGSAEFILKVVPLRFGSYWDGRGKGKDDDHVYVTGGLGYLRPAKLGGIGVDIGAGFSQQVDGPKQPRLETVIGINIGLRIHPDL